MDPARWKQVQRLAYPFFGLIYLHVFIARLRPALSGAASVFVSAWPYLLVIGLYAVLRVVRPGRDRTGGARKPTRKRPELA